jgi:hypothetical protein
VVAVAGVSLGADDCCIGCPALPASGGKAVSPPPHPMSARLNVSVRTLLGNDFSDIIF